MIERIERVSRPGLRIYKGRDDIPSVMNGWASPSSPRPKGVMTDRKARPPVSAAKCSATSPKGRIEMSRSGKDADRRAARAWTCRSALSRSASKGSLGTLVRPVNELVTVKNDGGTAEVRPANDSAEADAMSGTMRALVANMVDGVSKGFEKKLTLVGVGFRARRRAPS